MYSAVGKARPLSPEARRAERERAAEGLRAAADYAAPAGVSLAIEPLNRFETDMVNTAEQGLELCDLVGRANVGLTLDTWATAEYVSCFGSGTIRDELTAEHGSPFAVETAHIRLRSSDLTARIYRSLFDTARQYRESIDVFGSKQSFEWALVEGERHVLPKPVRRFTTSCQLDLRRVVRPRVGAERRAAGQTASLHFRLIGSPLQKARLGAAEIGPSTIGAAFPAEPSGAPPRLPRACLVSLAISLSSPPRAAA
ncbi:MAG TPA: TIM barrel protein [Acidimicrobiales bacterium]|nr:TIM barrel protein [Acidimicrobiales bacterium]